MCTWPTLDQCIHPGTLPGAVSDETFSLLRLQLGAVTKSICYHLGRSYQGIKSTENRKLKQDILATSSEYLNPAAPEDDALLWLFSYRSQYISFSDSSRFRVFCHLRPNKSGQSLHLSEPVSALICKLMAPRNPFHLEQASDFDCETQQNNSCRLSTAPSKESHPTTSIYSFSLPFIPLWMRKPSSLLEKGLDNLHDK